MICCVWSLLHRHRQPVIMCPVMFCPFVKQCRQVDPKNRHIVSLHVSSWWCKRLFPILIAEPHEKSLLLLLFGLHRKKRNLPKQYLSISITINKRSTMSTRPKCLYIFKLVLVYTVLGTCFWYRSSTFPNFYSSSKMIELRNCPGKTSLSFTDAPISFNLLIMYTGLISEVLCKTPFLFLDQNKLMVCYILGAIEEVLLCVMWYMCSNNITPHCVVVLHCQIHKSSATNLVPRIFTWADHKCDPLISCQSDWLKSGI